MTKNQEFVALYHTHGDSSLLDNLLGVRDYTFSEKDKEQSDKMKKPMYLGNSFGDILVYDPSTKKTQSLGKVR